MSIGKLPECARRIFDEHHTLLLLARRVSKDWYEDVLSALHGSNISELLGIDPTTMFEGVTADDLRQSLLPVSRRGAEDLMKLLAVGSFYSGPDASLRKADPARDDCVREIIGTVGEEAEFFTNHGHAEDGEEADFFASSFHFNSLAETLYDVSLIAISSEHLLIAWRFEDA
ncbi:hypothetical protein ACFXKG_11410 [Streptomyces sp. NPDC059255]|uniref:hypothetical protein n=1 Tax=Streptomyces sp. NPDC059255 TaxID=3346793 RepID=UPI0036BAC2C9